MAIGERETGGPPAGRGEGGISRRRLLATGAVTAGGLALGPTLLRDALAAPARGGVSPYGRLRTPDSNGIQLPKGFESRLIARAGTPVAGTGYVLPIFPDGQATFRTEDGGWILVTNSESLAAVGAGTSAIRFDRRGTISDAYRILGDTNVNCAGGPTPWGTWLSGEEAADGMIWECDPAGAAGGPSAAPARCLQARGRCRRPGRRPPLSDRGRSGGMPLSLHAG